MFLFLGSLVLWVFKGQKMKILKEGKTISPTTYSGTCAVCGCEVEAQEEELTYDEKSTSLLFFVICPTLGCSNRIHMLNVKVFK